jgi:peptidoglycan/xylan/chitin deacetylase (PgdA/CDA1 family)
MKIPGLKTAQKIGQQWCSRFVKSGLILGYHRVVETPYDPYELCVSPDHFAAQMAYLHQHMQPLSLYELVDQALAGKLPPRAVAVTFDDGYADNLRTALPILARYEVPATLFVTTGYWGGEFWWDELARLVQCRESIWWQTAVPHLQAHDLHTFYNWLLPLSEAVRREELDKLWLLLGGKQPGSPLVLTEAEVYQLSASSWLEIGSHTVTHPMLNLLTPEEQAYEICTSREVLEKIIGQPVRAFSYPNGRYTPHTITLTQAAGYTLACTSSPHIVWHKSNRHCLPRIWARDEPVKRFSDKWLRA